MMNFKKNAECQQGHYGKDCRQKYSVNCYLEDRYDRFNGKCDKGCKPDWIGNVNVIKVKCRLNYCILFL